MPVTLLLIVLGRLDTYSEQVAKPGAPVALVDALATLEARGLGRDAQREMRAHLEAMTGMTGEPGPVSSASSPARHAADVRMAQLALHAWYKDWAETVRLVVGDRRSLIRLGLAQRRPSKDRRLRDDIG